MPPPRRDSLLNSILGICKSKHCIESGISCITYAALPDRKSKVAFTLAEVLITLSIIGVVAALTMPTMIQNHKKNETSARLKKFYSVMSQAVILSELENGPVSEWTMSDVTDGFSSCMSGKEFFTNYLAKYIKYTKTDDSGCIVYLPDSSKFSLLKGDCIDIIFDTNGDSKPNIEGRDQYRFLFCQSSGKFTTYRFMYQSPKYSRDYFLERCKNDVHFCSTLLHYDNWEFRSDYPYRL